MIFIGAGVSLADGWKGDNGKRAHAYGRYKHRIIIIIIMCAQTGLR